MFGSAPATTADRSARLPAFLHRQRPAVLSVRRRGSRFIRCRHRRRSQRGAGQPGRSTMTMTEPSVRPAVPRRCECDEALPARSRAAAFCPGRGVRLCLAVNPCGISWQPGSAYVIDADPTPRARRDGPRLPCTVNGGQNTYSIRLDARRVVEGRQLVRSVTRVPATTSTAMRQCGRCGCGGSGVCGSGVARVQLSTARRERATSDSRVAT